MLENSGRANPSSGIAQEDETERNYDLCIENCKLRRKKLLLVGKEMRAINTSLFVGGNDMYEMKTLGKNPIIRYKKNTKTL